MKLINTHALYNGETECHSMLYRSLKTCYPISFSVHVKDQIRTCKQQLL